MKLTDNFSLKELTASGTARRMNIDNTPDLECIVNLQKLCLKLLQPLRTIYGEAFHINSGFRSSKLNNAVDAVSTSQHMRGQAADIRVRSPRQLLECLMRSGLDFDQAILYPTFLHLSYNAHNNLHQVLYAKGVKP